LGKAAAQSWVGRCATIAVVVGLALVTIIWTAQTAVRAHGQSAIGMDFEISVWDPGRDTINGVDPLRHYNAEGHDGGAVYPPISSVVTLPFSLPPYELGLGIWLAALVGAVLGSLWICGVRDWRCYVAACACPPVTSGVLYGNISLLLVLGIALAWRFRSRAWLVGSLVGLIVAMKIFLWPLAVWLAITRRRFAAAISIACGGLFTLVGWASIGFVGFADYPAMIERRAADTDHDGVSVAALAAQLGIARIQTVALAVGLVALLVAYRLRRNDLSAFAWAVSAALLASPVVWTHYYALLVVPLAIAVPVWTPMWFAPFAMFPQVLDTLAGVGLSVLVAARASGATLGRIRRKLAGHRPLVVAQSDGSAEHPV